MASQPSGLMAAMHEPCTMPPWRPERLLSSTVARFSSRSAQTLIRPCSCPIGVLEDCPSVPHYSQWQSCCTELPVCQTVQVWEKHVTQHTIQYDSVLLPCCGD